MSLAFPLLGVILLQFNQGTAVLTDTVVVAGDSAILYCSGLNIDWRRHPLGHGPEYETVFIGNSFTENYSSSVFRIDGNQSLYNRNLIIETVTLDLAGKYECIEFDENISSTQLMVLEKLPECDVTMDKFIGPNDCNVPQDYTQYIQLSCSVGYRGEKAPELEWRMHKDTIEVLTSNCITENNNRTKCKVTVKPDMDLNGVHFVCQTTTGAAKEQYNCAVDITVLYSFSADESKRTAVVRGDRVECVANSSQECSYKWVWYEKVGNDYSRTIESTDHVLIAGKLGLHRCEAQCDLRNHSCLVYPKFIKVIPNEESLGQSGQQQAMLAQENEEWTQTTICLLILGVLPYIAFGVFLFTRTRRKKQLDESLYKTSESINQADLQPMNCITGEEST